jgi:hypothetical protein
MSLTKSFFEVAPFVLLFIGIVTVLLTPTKVWTKERKWFWTIRKERLQREANERQRIWQQHLDDEYAEKQERHRQRLDRINQFRVTWYNIAEEHDRRYPKSGPPPKCKKMKPLSSFSCTEHRALKHELE